MNYNFFAGALDKAAILEYIFKQTNLRVFDLSSDYDKEITEYKSTAQILEKFNLADGDKFATTFQLWHAEFKGRIIFRKIMLDPKRCKGHTFRYASGGWGCIQLYFGGIKNNQLNQSHIGHLTEKGAREKETINEFYGAVNDWDWNNVEQTSRKLKYQIDKKLSIRRIGSVGVLNGADTLAKEGVILR